MALTDMKRTKKEIKEQEKGCSLISTADKYPWGLNINLDTNEIEKLGLDLAQFPPTSTVKIVCEAKVRSVSITDRDEDAPSKSLSLQITKMDVTPPDTPKRSLYNDYAKYMKKGPNQ